MRHPSTPSHPAPQPLVPVIAGICGAVVFTAVLGPTAVHPGNIDWVMRGDYGVHFLGWHLFRTGPWGLPPGASPHLIWPVGSSVALTDSVPLAAFVFKLLDPLLPPVFQYVGLWLVSCWALQGVFGALLMRLVTPRPVLQLLGALLFLMTPPFIVRLGHEALTAHWVLLAGLWLSCRPGADQPRARQAVAWTLLLGVTALIHPYLLLMVAAFLAATCLRQAVRSPAHFVRIGAQLAVSLAVASTMLWAGGSFVVPPGDGLAVGGYGAFSANLLTFVLPVMAQSAFAPGPVSYASSLQSEGYSYMGAGVLVLGAIAAIAVAQRPRPWLDALRVHWPLVLALLVLAAFAVGPVVTAGPRTLFTYDGRAWGPLAIFRSHGRMIWPLHYGLVAAMLVVAARFRPSLATGVIAACVLLQAADVAGMSRFVADMTVWGYRDPLASRFWDVAAPHYERIVMVPTNVCDRDGAQDGRAFALLAGRHGLGLNAGSTARYDVRRAAEYCGELERDLREGRWDDRSLYVVRPDLLPALAAPGRPGAPQCGLVDGFGVCVSGPSARGWPQEVDWPAAYRP